jgi:hypothetical protein
MCSDPLTWHFGAVLVPLLWSFDLLGSPAFISPVIRVGPSLDLLLLSAC